MRRAANIDRTHAEIVNALRGMGCSVIPQLAQLGHGIPDLLIGVAGRDQQIEIKSFPAHTEKGRLNPEQQRHSDEWRGSPIRVVHSLEDVVDVVKQLKTIAHFLEHGNLIRAV